MSLIDLLIKVAQLIVVLLQLLDAIMKYFQ
ncbi:MULTISPECIES: type I toxin-antitoxin system toxin TisB [Buttiauxella]|jgi:type I toxin-antitoxin system toxin TisB|uniref:Toxic peptide TisB n=1 Tax=Buttiauxella agrestis TaxID=82977 RepID=A0A381KNA4_9ENTR|nr:MULTISPECIES: type I toxin-antitoxin system toxin TisB [Buttiauxella]TDX11874.1 type I toxin-antitoxin system toxin TisB [Buttiauxella sp. BIGb0552]SUY92840.1 Uncharacterised protein [Buttiauxella agrestis]